MTKLLLSTIFFLISSCIADRNPKFILKKISTDDVNIKWYYHSYITDNSPEIIEISKNGIIDTILEAKEEITNINLKGDQIIVRLHNPQPGLTMTKNIKKEIFGYKIIIDSNGTWEEKALLPQPIKEE
jgi:hypothetical protein